MLEIFAIFSNFLGVCAAAMRCPIRSGMTGKIFVSAGSDRQSHK